MRLFLKFVHVVAVMLFIGAVATFLAVHAFIDGLLPSQVAGVLPALGYAAAWIALPALLVALTSGAFLMVQQPAFFAARWVWAKAAVGCAIGVVYVPFGATPRALWIALALALLTVAIAMWRPALGKR